MGEADEATGGTGTLLRLDSVISKYSAKEDTLESADCRTVEVPAEAPTLQRVVSQRVEQALQDAPPPVSTRTDEERGYCSEPEELSVDESDWQILGDARKEPPPLVRTRTDEERGYCSEPEEPVISTAS